MARLAAVTKLHTRLTERLAAPWRAANARRVAVGESRGVSDHHVMNLALLLLFGAGIIILNGWMAQWRSVPEHPRAFMLVLVGQFVLYAAAAFWVTIRRLPLRGALAIIILVALAARLAFVAQAPTVSDDIYRYVWDGRVQAVGINPYRYTPADPALTGYRDEMIYPFINRKAVPTIYPPVAQGIFRVIYALHQDSVAWTRIAFSGFDLLTIAVIAGLLLRLGLRPEQVLLYAWHPLLILELGHSGHIDIVTICFLTLALWARLSDRPWRAGFLLACAALTKFYALIALPALLFQSRRRDLRLPLATVVTIALAYLPFLSVGPAVFGYLRGYVQEEGIASGDRFYPLALLKRWGDGTLPTLPLPWGLPQLGIAQVYAGAVLLAMTALALWCWLRPLDSPRAIPVRILLLFTVFIALTTPTYPWYSLLILGFVPFAGKRLMGVALLLVSAAAFLYLQWWWPASGSVVRAIAYGGGFFGLLFLASAGIVRSR
jgi:alpha-1,6-mannosyltransferase